VGLQSGQHQLEKLLRVKITCRLSEICSTRDDLSVHRLLLSGHLFVRIAPRQDCSSSSIFHSRHIANGICRLLY